MGAKLIGRASDQAINSYIKSVQEILDFMPGPSRSYPDGANSQDLYSILRQFRDAKATDERDNIYALLGLCIDAQVNGFPKADYTKSTMEVIRDTVSYICHCDLRDEVQVPYTTLHQFLDDLDCLEDTMILHLLKLADATNVLSLLHHAGGRINTTLEMLRKAANNKLQEKRILELLLQQHNAEPLLFPTTKYSWTPLWWAAENGHEAVVELLVEKGVDIEANDGLDTTTALQLAARNGHEAIVRLLLEKGADFNANILSVGSNTPLHSAAMNGHEVIVRLLLEKGADLRKNADLEAIAIADTPLHAAAQNGHDAIVRLLLEKGADIEAKGCAFQKPL
ncbi:ankyrin repeat-containing domain protein [Nemania serpens]|nr:ankyrin repeat-containing domain protein [Nemania serpens]